MRIRTIKPDFFSSPQVVACSPWARLLFIGLWLVADDHGWAAFDPGRCRLELFPADTVDVLAMAAELTDVGLVQPHLDPTTGKVILHIPGFGRHQYIQHKGKPRFAIADLTPCTLDGTPTGGQPPAPILMSLHEDSCNLMQPLEEEEEEEEGKRRETTPAERPDVDRVLEAFRSSLTSIEVKLRPVTKRDRDAVRLMLDEDGRSEDQIIAATRFAHGDSFWRANIHSPATLRAKYDQLRLAAQRTKTSRRDRFAGLREARGGQDA